MQCRGCCLSASRYDKKKTLSILLRSSSLQFTIRVVRLNTEVNCVILNPKYDFQITTLSDSGIEGNTYCRIFGSFISEYKP